MPQRSQLRLGWAPFLRDTLLATIASTLITFVPASSAQIIDFAPETTSFPTSTTSSDPSSSITRSSASRSQTTFFSSISARNSTHNATTTSTDRGSLPLGPANDGPMDTGQQQSTGSGLLNYYFAFLAVFIVILLLAAWYIHRRKKRMKALRASSRQNALNRDLDGWAGGRRWVGGAFRGGLRRQQEREQHSREEGLNELGEAPPPYKARASVTSVQGAPPEHRMDSAQADGPSEPSIPLRTLHRPGQSTSSPPDYHESFQTSPSDSSESSVAAPRHTFARTNTSDHNANPSS